MRRTVAVALQAETVGVVLDLVEPIGAGGDCGGFGGEAEIKELEHAAEIGISDRDWQSTTRPQRGRVAGPCVKEEAPCAVASGGTAARVAAAFQDLVGLLPDLEALGGRS